MQKSFYLNKEDDIMVTIGYDIKEWRKKNGIDRFKSIYADRKKTAEGY